MASNPASTIRSRILAAFLALVFPAACEKSPPASPDSGQSPGVVYKVTTRIVAEHLKAPSTAKFPSFYDDGAVTCVSLGTDRYLLSSYVDSQNSFGAMIRTRWTARVSVLGDRVTAEDLAIGDKAIEEFTERRRDDERRAYVNSPQYKADAARMKAEYDAQQKQIAADRLAEEQRVERENAATAERERVAAVQKKMTDERAAAWVFPRVVTTTAPVQIQSRFGTVTIPAGTKVKATEARQGMVRIEHSGSTVLVPPATVGVPPQP